MPPNQQQVATVLTLVVVGVWIAAVIARGFFARPVETPAVLDTAVAAIIGFWFFTRRNGNGGGK